MHGAIVRTAPFTREIIESADELEVIGRHGVGVDNIDIEAAPRRRIPVVYTPNANMVSVAEHTIGFILALTKRLFISDKATREGNFAIREECAAIDLEGKTLGIIGLGRVGSTLAKKCKAAFDMKVIVYDPYLSSQKVKEMGISLCHNLSELLKESDIVSIHAPLTKECVIRMATEVAKGVLDVLRGDKPEDIANLALLKR